MVIIVGLCPEHTFTVVKYLVSAKICLWTRPKLLLKLGTKDRKDIWGFIAEFFLKLNLKNSILFCISENIWSYSWGRYSNYVTADA